MRTIVVPVLLSMMAAWSASLQSQQSSGPVVLRNIRVVDGTGSVASTNQTIVIEDGKISAVGDRSRVQIPRGAQELDLAGHTALPGLVLLHEHLFFVVNDQFSHALPFSAPRLYLAFGVTTIRTAGTDHPYLEINLRRAIERGDVPGPEIHLTSPYFNGPGSGILSEITLSDPEEARAAVRYWAAQGFQWFKVYTHVSRPVLEAIVDEAHKHRARVTGHLQSVSCADAADAGIDNVEHSWFSCLADLRPSGAGDSRDARANALFLKLVKAHVTLTATPVDRVRSLSERELEVLHPAARESYRKMRALVGTPGAPPAPPRGEGPLSLRFVKAGGRLGTRIGFGCGFRYTGIRVARGGQASRRGRFHASGRHSHRHLRGREVSRYRRPRRQHCAGQGSRPPDRARRSLDQHPGSVECLARVRQRQAP